MAYNAYRKYLDDLKKEGKKEKVLPGFKQYTPQQLFWMKYANVCFEQIATNLFNYNIIFGKLWLKNKVQ